MNLFTYLKSVIYDPIGNTYSAILSDDVVIKAVRDLDERLDKAELNIDVNPFNHFTTIPIDQLRVLFITVSPLDAEDEDGIIKVLEKESYDTDITQWTNKGVMKIHASPLVGEFADIFMSIFIPIMDRLNNQLKLVYILSGIDIIQTYTKYIKVNDVILCDYPRTYKFKGDNCFKRLNDKLETLDRELIDW